MKTVNIKGKQYVEVSERVKEFHNRFKEGSITTEIVSHADGVVVMKATVRPYAQTSPEICYTGFAFEKQDDKRSLVNQTSYIENCETSAVGRALGFCGIGIDASIASADEVKNAVQQELISIEKLKQLQAYVIEAEADEKKFCEYLGVESLDRLPASDIRKAMEALKAKIKSKKAVKK